MLDDHIVLAVVIAVSALLIFLSARKCGVRAVLLMVVVAQLFSWPTTLLYVQFGLQTNPVRLFQYATQSNFLFAFIFFPSTFSAYCAFYPKRARTRGKALYTLAAVGLPIVFHIAVSLLSNLIHVPNHTTRLLSYALNLLLYSISRIYIVWFFRKYFPSGRGLC